MSNKDLVQPVASPKKSKVHYVYAIIGVALVLFLLGALGWVVLNVTQLSNAFKEKVQVQVIFNDATKEESALEMLQILKDQKFTLDAEYIDKNKAAEQFKAQVGKEFLDVLEANPLYSSVDLHIKSNYLNADSLLKIKKFIEQSNIVREVYYETNLVDIMNSNVKRLGIVVLIISLMLILAVIILIDNTIRLAMFSNRFLIKTMQFVGATRLFIAKPFVLRSILNGVVSGVIAVIMILALKGWAESYLPEMRSLHTLKGMVILCSSIILIGVFISVLSTYRSVIKYLKTSLDELY